MKRLFAGIVLLVFTVFSENVGKLQYSGIFEDIDGDTVGVPTGVVAFSEEVHAGTHAGVLQTNDTLPPAVMFVIDNSTSMATVSHPNNGYDPDGVRFKVTRELIDSIYKVNSESEVGLSIFGQYLIFNPADNSLFVNSAVHKGGYLPLLKLDSLYELTYVDGTHDTINDNGTIKYITTKDTMTTGMKGIDVLKWVLRTRKNDPFTKLTYTDDYLWSPIESMGRTNISAGMDATREAFANTTVDKDMQYVIFISDGDATNNDAGATNAFTLGKNYATTFAIFLKSSAPASITAMVNNIKKNKYSNTNPASTLFASSINYSILTRLRDFPSKKGGKWSIPPILHL